MVRSNKRCFGIYLLFIMLTNCFNLPSSILSILFEVSFHASAGREVCAVCSIVLPAKPRVKADVTTFYLRVFYKPKLNFCQRVGTGMIILVLSRLPYGTNSGRYSRLAHG
jgi:hypothetical protein